MSNTGSSFKKIACCIFGQQRAFPLLLPNYLDYWVSDGSHPHYDWEVDWFCHTSRVNKTHPHRHESLKQKFNYDMPEVLGDREEYVLRDFLKCKKYKIEENYSGLYDIMNKYLPFISDSVQREYGLQKEEEHLRVLFFHAIYSASRVIKMVREYENENEFKYDMVFVMRPDVQWIDGSRKPPVEFELIDNVIKEREISYPQITERVMAVGGMHVHSGWGMMSDWYYWGTSDSIQNFALGWTENLFSLLTWYTNVERYGLPEFKKSKKWNVFSNKTKQHRMIPILDRLLECLGRRHPLSMDNNNETLWYTFGEKSFACQMTLNNMTSIHPQMAFKTGILDGDYDLRPMADRYPIWEPK